MSKINGGTKIGLKSQKSSAVDAYPPDGAGTESMRKQTRQTSFLSRENVANEMRDIALAFTSLMWDHNALTDPVRPTNERDIRCREYTCSSSFTLLNPTERACRRAPITTCGARLVMANKEVTRAHAVVLRITLPLLQASR